MPFTVSHAKSLTIPDSTNTDIVRPVDWNSRHLITYSPSGAELLPAFSDGGNVSFSTNPSGYLVASAPAGGGGGGIAVSAGSQVATTNTVVFANSNGISFGMSGSSQITASYTVPVQTAYQFDNSNGVSFGTNAGTVTASVRTDYQSAGAYLTTAANSTHSHGAISMSLAGGLSGTYSSASSGLTLSLTQAAGAVSPINFSAGTTSSSLTAVTFGDGGNVTFGLGTGASAGVITASAPSGGAGGVALSAGSQSIGTGTVAFANSNGISFGMSGSNQITASYTVPNVPAQTVQPAVAQLNGSSGTLSIVAGSSLSASSNASTITLGLASNWSTTIMPLGNSTGYASSVLSNTFLTTAAQSGHSHGNPTLALTNLSGTTGSASNGFTLSLSAAAPGGGGGVAVSAGSDSLFTSGTMSFGNANGFSFITSNGSVVGSYTDAGGAGGGLNTINLIGNVSGNTSVSQNAGSIYFSGGPGVTVSGTGNTVVMSAGEILKYYAPFNSGISSNTFRIANDNLVAHLFPLPNLLAISYVELQMLWSQYASITSSGAGISKSNQVGSTFYVGISKQNITNPLVFDAVANTSVTASLFASCSVSSSSISAGMTFGFNGVSDSKTASTVSGNYSALSVTKFPPPGHARIVMPIPLTTTLSPGVYLFGLGLSSSRASADVAPFSGTIGTAIGFYGYLKQGNMNGGLAVRLGVDSAGANSIWWAGVPGGGVVPGVSLTSSVHLSQFAASLESIYPMVGLNGMGF